jgi:hypothetical protein
MTNESRTGFPFEKAVKEAFKKSKEDISTLNTEFEDFKNIIVSLHNEISHLKEKNTILQDLAQSNANSIAILTKKESQNIQTDPLSSSGTSSIGNERVPNRAEQELVKVFKRNKPHIVKNKIIELIHDDEYPLYEIFHIIVEQQQLCGKTTFYRYVKDLEQEGIIEVILYEGKRTVRTSST